MTWLVDDRSGQAERRFDARLKQLRARLRADHPELTDEVIDAAMKVGELRTADDRIEIYRVLFVERHARSILRAGEPAAWLLLRAPVGR